MERKRQPDSSDEPAVTFEIDETPRETGRSRLGAAGAAAAAGAGLISTGAAPSVGDSLDVFDQDQESDEAGPSGGAPVTSYEDLGDIDSEFPRIDFGESIPVDADASPAVEGGDVFGATADVGGGFSLEDGVAAEAFGASAGDGEGDPVPDTLVDDGGLADGSDAEPDELDDIDLS